MVLDRMLVAALAVLIGLPIVQRPSAQPSPPQQPSRK